jgi:hypothetical protein
LIFWNPLVFGMNQRVSLIVIAMITLGIPKFCCVSIISTGFNCCFGTSDVSFENCAEGTWWDDCSHYSTNSLVLLLQSYIDLESACLHTCLEWRSR